MESSRRSAERNRTCSSTARASSDLGPPAMRRNRSLIAKTCSRVRGGGGDIGGRLAFHAPSWRIRSRSLSVTTARMSSFWAMVGVYDVARHAADPRRHSAAVRWSGATGSRCGPVRCRPRRLQVAELAATIPGTRRGRRHDFGIFHELPHDWHPAAGYRLPELGRGCFRIAGWRQDLSRA